ncbi:DUF6090 family protein [Ichthyenterobacterium sp. W332]|uniref:DUF6090 family protein n=1 Tax=Microcosmobacter mediterraneus TaxID=3075607 RepID=A0ABU2YJ39_9FLAO|nr:DUF6090 family protein [Ichthyenterobacterium sp. W332]MDT0558186.1 DUF6090 family protein [Ichthyenterobacterium sp. W332]
MIKFFRHIRQNLLMENKTGKYFKYAIGEIILVVLGILIALQINNWNETQKGNKLAKNYAIGLVRDLSLDTSQLNNYIKFHERTISGLNALIRHKDKDLNNTSVNDSVYKLFRLNCLNIAEFESNQNTLTQIKNTGDLVLFDEQIRDSIIVNELSYNSVLSQGRFYKNAYDDNMELSKKVFDYTVFIDTTYFILKNNTRLYTGKQFPKANYDHGLKQLLFNEITILKGVSELYLAGELKPHLKNTERIINFLSKTYDLKSESQY